jgi:hypothetical protein
MVVKSSLAKGSIDNQTNRYIIAKIIREVFSMIEGGADV